MALHLKYSRKHLPKDGIEFQRVSPADNPHTLTPVGLVQVPMNPSNIETESIRLTTVVLAEYESPSDGTICKPTEQGPCCSARSIITINELQCYLQNLDMKQAAETVWSAFAFVLHGESVPLGKGSLTPLGAQQMLSQGAALRDRWLTNMTTPSSDLITISGNAPIAGIETVGIDNSQLGIYSTLDDAVTGGALAFMQGLYPPASQTFSSVNGGVTASRLADNTLVDFPLNGYMYPNIQTSSVSDPDSIWSVPPALVPRQAFS